MNLNKAVFILALGATLQAQAAIEDAKPQARIEEGLFIVTWEVNEGPVRLDSVSVFDFGALRFLEGCEFKGKTETMTLSSSEAIEVGLDGIRYQCTLTDQNPTNLVLSFRSVKNDMTIPASSFHYPEDFEAIKDIDPKNVDPDNWITSTYMEFTFYRPELLADPIIYRFEQEFTPPPEPVMPGKSLEEIRSLAAEGVAEAQYLLGKSLLEAKDEKNAYYWLNQATMQNSTRAALLHYLDFESKYSQGDLSPSHLMAASLGCNTANESIALSYHDFEFLKNNVFLTLILRPDFLYSSPEAFKADYLNWHARLKALENSLPNTKASYRIPVLRATVSKHTGLRIPTLAEQETLKEGEVYQHWVNYLTAVDQDSEFVGCYLPSSLLDQSGS